MTGPGVAISRPLRAIVVLLFLWAGGRATYEFAPLFFAATQASPLTAEMIAAEIRPGEPIIPQVDYNAPNAALLTAGTAASVRHAIAVSPKSLKPTQVAYQRVRPSVAEPRAAPLVERISDYAEARIDTQPRTGSPRRLSLSSWLLIRDGATGIAPAGTLGGSQVGMRAYLPIGQSIAATARISAPLRASGAEASVGFALRRGPLTLLIERRIALERGGRDDFSATIVAGVDGVRLPQQFRLDAYGQAGIVGRDGFADGAVRVERPVGKHGKSEIALGAGVWGGAQPGIARVDAGPQVVVRMPIAGGYLRASGEWRQRIASNAQPTSGPALTLGMDF